MPDDENITIACNLKKSLCHYKLSSLYTQQYKCLVVHFMVENPACMKSDCHVMCW